MAVPGALRASIPSGDMDQWTPPDPTAAPGAAGPASDGGAEPAADQELLADVEHLQVIAADLADVEVALDRLADGSYGTCEACGQTIDDADLARRPTARRCPDHLPLATT